MPGVWQNRPTEAPGVENLKKNITNLKQVIESRKERPNQSTIHMAKTANRYVVYEWVCEGHHS